MNKIKAIMSIKEQHKINNQDINNNHIPTKNESNIKQIPLKTIKSSQVKSYNKDEIIAIPSAKTRLKPPIIIQPKDENLVQLNNLWNILGVTPAYKNLFDIVSSQIPSLYKSSYYSKEIAKMTQLKVLIQKLNRDISSREKIIELLKTYDDYITLEYNNNGNKKINEKILNEVKAVLRDLRIISINIVGEYKKIRKEIGYEALCGKYNIGNIENYKMDYLMKMKEDTAFLSKSTLGNWFRFSSEEDVFLSSLRREVPCEEGIGLLITECQFAMINEILINQLYTENKDSNGIDNDEDNYDKEENELYVERNDVKIVKKVKTDEVLSKVLNENIANDIMKEIDDVVEKQVDIQDKDGEIEMILQRERDNKLKKKKEEKEAQLLQEKELRLQKLKESQLQKEKELQIEKENESKQQKAKEKELQLQKDKELKQQKDSAKEKALKSLENHIPNLQIQSNEIEYIYESFSGHINVIQSIYTSLYNQLDSELVTALNIKDNIIHYITGSYPRIIQVKGKDNIIYGIAILTYDSNNLNGNKLIISNIFCINYTNFGNFFLSFIDYCQKNYNYDEINIDLYYGFKDDKFYLIKPIEELIKTKAKFRWVNMENDGKVRKIKYKLSHAVTIKDNQLNNDLVSLPKIDAIQIRSCSLLSLQESEFKDKDCNNNESEVLAEGDDDKNQIDKPKILLKDNENTIFKIPLISLLCEMLYNNEYSIDHSLVQYMNLEAMKEISLPIIYNSIKTSKEDINDIIKENMQELVKLFPLTKQPDSKEQFLCSSLLNINLSFNTISLTKVNDCLYNRLSFDKIDVFSLNSSNTKEEEEDLFYLLKTSNEHISIMIYENQPGKNGRLSHYFNTTTTQDLLTDAFNEIYPNLIPKPSLSKKTIYIPSITIERNYLHEAPTIVNNLTITTEDGKTFKPEYLHQMDVLYFTLINDTSPQNLLIFNTDEIKDDIIIKEDFLMAIIHHDILKEFEIANIAAYIIKPKAIHS